MTKWLVLLRAIFTFSTSITEYFRNRQLIEAGKLIAKNEALINAKEEIDNANIVRNSIHNDHINRVLNEHDPNLRD